MLPLLNRVPLRSLQSLQTGYLAANVIGMPYHEPTEDPGKCDLVYPNVGEINRPVNIFGGERRQVVIGSRVDSLDICSHPWQINLYAPGPLCILLPVWMNLLSRGWAT